MVLLGLTWVDPGPACIMPFLCFDLLSLEFGRLLNRGDEETVLGDILQK